MRVISGSAKGRRLKTPRDDRVRPTTDKIKEAVFSMVQFSLYDAVFLDLFSGTGQMGIEALSRGAKTAYFVDASAESLKLTKENIAAAGFSGSAVVSRSDYATFLSTLHTPVDIAFLDPPYHHEILPKALPLLAPHMSENGVILCEYAEDEKIPDQMGKFSLQKVSRYGKIRIGIYRPQEENR